MNTMIHARRPAAAAIAALAIVAALLLGACATQTPGVAVIDTPTPPMAPEVLPGAGEAGTPPAQQPETVALPLVWRCYGPGCPTATPVVTATPTLTATVTPTVTFTPSPTPTDTATPTPSPTPLPGDPLVYDCEGDLSNTSWLTQTFGAVTWEQSPAAPLTALHARCGDAPAVLVAHVQDEAGAPLANVTVVFYWSDAPLLPAELRNCGLTRGIYGPTNAEGNIGFGLGGGSYYWPPAGGPHSLWLPDGACVHGLGMLAATNHHHLDADWTAAFGPRSEAEALQDWGYTLGTLVYTETVGGREMQVVYWPGESAP